LLKESYMQAAGYSLAAIVLLVFIHFRYDHVRGSGVAARRHRHDLDGCYMGWFHVSFNPANIMTLPLVIGHTGYQRHSHS